MDLHTLTLTLPSVAVLAALVAHSLRALPRRRALGFWLAVTAYGVVRGAAVTWITASALGSPVPYVIHDPLFTVLGVSLQEVAGWAIVAYLGWWLGCRLSERLFVQVAWGSLFLGAVSWAVESAAVAAGWWHWTVPLSSRLLGGSPWIGLVDWFFVGTDFLLPFAVLTAPALRGKPLRWLALVTFPVHFAAHLAPARLSATFPVPGHHLAHWALLAVLLWWALRSPAEDRPFGPRPASIWRWVPALGLTVILADTALVQWLVAGRPDLLPSVVPALGVGVVTLWPVWGLALGGAAALAALLQPPWLLAAVPAAARLVLTGGLGRAGKGGRRRIPRWVAAAAVLALAGLGFAVHARSARREGALTAGLDQALAARDRGDLETARDRLAALGEEFPGSAVPLYMLAEIHYKTDRLAAARPLLYRAVEIQQDLTAAYRYLAVTELRSGREAAAARAAERGLAVEPGDPELVYLGERALGGGRERTLAAVEERGPETAAALAGLAFEVDDAVGAAALVDDALSRWPEHRALYPTRIRLALAAGDRPAARRVAAAFQRRFPGDVEAERAVRALAAVPE